MAYKLPQKKAGRDRPAKKDEKVILKELFSTDDALFTRTTLELYGKQTQIEYRYVDLIWGKGLHQMLRFVLVKYNGTQSILVSTCLELSPEAFIRLYSSRFRIKQCFRELKQQISGFGYHFWTQAMPKFSHFRKKSLPDPLNDISSDKLRSAINAIVRAVEGFVMFSCIAMGLLQILSLQYSDALDLQNFRYLRTRSSCIASEGITMCFFAEVSFALWPRHLI